MTKTPNELLNLPVEDTNTDAKTLGQYLFQLLESLILEGEGFDLVSPFGVEEWHVPITHALILEDVIDGALDEYGRIEDYDGKQWTKTLSDLFYFLQKADYATIELPPVPKDHHLVEKGRKDYYDNLILGYEECPYTEEDAKNEALARNSTGTGDTTWYAIKLA